MDWEWRENNREKVLASLQKGEYQAILSSREGTLDALAHLASELGVLQAVTEIKLSREREGIPDELVLRISKSKMAQGLKVRGIRKLCQEFNRQLGPRSLPVIVFAAGTFTVLPLE